MQVEVGDPTGVLDGELLLPARTGRMLGLGLELPGGGTVVSSNAEITSVTDTAVRFGPALAAQTQVRLRTDRTVIAAEVRRHGDLTLVTGPGAAELAVDFG